MKSLAEIRMIVDEKNRKNFEALGGMSMYGYKTCENGKEKTEADIKKEERS